MQLSSGRLEAAGTSLRGLEGPEADALSARLAALSAVRDRALAQVEHWRSRAPEAPHEEVEQALLALPERATDPAVAEAVDVLRSDLVDVYATARSRGMRWDTPKRGEQVEPQAEPETSLAESLVSSLEEGVAPALVVAESPVASAPEARDFEARVPADTDEASVAIASAVAPRTTPTGVSTPADDATSQPALRSPSGARASGGSMQSPSEPSRPLERVREHEDAGEYAEALALVTEALEQPSVSESERRRWEHERSRIAGRQALLDALVEAAGSGARSLMDSKIEGAEAGGVRYGDWRKLVPWERVDPQDLLLLERVATLDRSARLGLGAERLAAGREADGDAILGRLWRSSDDEAERLTISAVVAWYRGEPLPARGYAWFEDRWVAPESLDSIAREARLTALVERLAKVEGARRDEAWSELHGMGRPEVLAGVLETRWGAAAETWDGLRQRASLERLVEARHELDERREALLERIEDTYEYPHELDAEGAAKRKAQSQSWIDARTRELRELLDGSRTVRVDRRTQPLLEELAWLDAQEAELELGSTLRPPALPPWLLVVARSGQDELELGNFAWDEDERRRLAWDRAVRARNASLFEALDEVPEEFRPNREEILQVRVTNDYRLLLGRSALAWDHRLQAAALDHSEYLSDTGDFGHSETIPGRETPGKRMRARGYPRPGGENCYAGSGGAEGAHERWVHSPGHHRNLVVRSHAAMASSLQGRYWTQVFGGEPLSPSDLERWFD